MYISRAAQNRMPHLICVRLEFCFFFIKSPVSRNNFHESGLLVKRIFAIEAEDFLDLVKMMLGSKDAIRIVPYFVLPQFYPIFAYREADAPLLCSYRGGSLSHKTTLVQAHRGFRLLTLASLNKKAFGYFCKIRSDRIFW